MKRISSIAALLLAILPVSAQGTSEQGIESQAPAKVLRPKDEISISYGIATLPDVAMSLGGILATALTFGAGKLSDMTQSGAFDIEYVHFLTPALGLGVSGGYEKITMVMDTYGGKDNDGNTLYNPGKRQHVNFFHIMPVFKARWFYRPHVSMYSKMAAGLSGCAQSTEGKDNDETTFSLAFQLSPVSIDFGGERFRGFAELGFGYQGLLCGGVRYAF